VASPSFPRELSLKVGDGGNRKGGISWGCLTPLLLTKERYAVSKDNIIQLIQPTNVDDQLTEILRAGARILLARRLRPRSRTFSASMPI